MLDIDHFKQINDSRPHPAGDAGCRVPASRPASPQQSGASIDKPGSASSGEENSPSCWYRYLPADEMPPVKRRGRRLLRQRSQTQPAETPQVTNNRFYVTQPNTETQPEDRRTDRPRPRRPARATVAKQSTAATAAWFEAESIHRKTVRGRPEGRENLDGLAFAFLRNPCASKAPLR